MLKALTRIIRLPVHVRTPCTLHPTRHLCTTDSDIESDSESDIMELKTVASRLNKFAPTSLAGSWDNVGLLVEPSPPHIVSRLVLTNDLTEAVMEEVLHVKADMVLSYHPPIFVPLKRLTQRTWKERILIRCLENRVAVFSPHTSYDAVQGGVNDWLIGPFEGEKTQIESVTSSAFLTPGGFVLEASLPGSLADRCLEDLKRICGVLVTSVVKQPDIEEVVRVQTNCTEKGLPKALEYLQAIEEVRPTIEITQLVKPPVPGHGPGRLVKLNAPITLQEAVQKVKALLNLPHVRLAKAVGVEDTSGTQLKTIAVCAGSGSSVLHGVVADLYITGEMSHHEVLDAVHRGRSVILCDHSNTERGFLQVLKGKLEELFENKIEITVSQTDKDPLNIV